MTYKPQTKVVHFLLHEVLSGSPPNKALKQAFQELGYNVDEFAPDAAPKSDIFPIRFELSWFARHFLRSDWRSYSAYSCTSEDPILVAGLLALVWRKPLIFISDEIKSGSYRGDRPDFYKRLCRWLMSKAALTIVNDESRLALQRDYAKLKKTDEVIVYPGCFVAPPKGKKQTEMKQVWGVREDQYVLCFSGGCNLSAGIDFTIDVLDRRQDVFVVTQPLAADELTRFLIVRTRNADRIYLQNERLSWDEAWSSAAAADVGVAIYRNQAPQFQNMGISSNRLCMFLAMGVPVIVSKQPSFDFLHDYECGIQVDTQVEFNEALATILADLDRYKSNALHCANEYIDAAGRYQNLRDSLLNALAN